MKTHKLIIPMLLICIGFANSYAFTRIKPGDTTKTFELVTPDNKPFLSDKMFDKFTLITIIREADKFTNKVLNDISELKDSKIGTSFNAWVIIESEINRRLVLEVPTNLREHVLFDPNGILNKEFGIIVLPATGAFSEQKKLLAYFPLWRESFFTDLKTGISSDNGKKGNDDAARVWIQKSKRDDYLRQANLLWASDKSDSAIIIIEDFLKTDSAWQAGYELLAGFLLKSANYAKAYDLYSLTLNKFAPTAENQLGLAKASIGLGNFSEALKYLASGQYMTAHVEEFLRLEGEIYYQMQEIDSALYKWRAAVESLLNKSEGLTDND